MVDGQSAEPFILSSIFVRRMLYCRCCSVYL